jgi:hypothetical protein
MSRQMHRSRETMDRSCGRREMATGTARSRYRTASLAQDQTQPNLQRGVEQSSTATASQQLRHHVHLPAAESVKERTLQQEQERQQEPKRQHERERELELEASASSGRAGRCFWAFPGRFDPRSWTLSY